MAVGGAVDGGAALPFEFGTLPGKKGGVLAGLGSEMERFRPGALEDCLLRFSRWREGVPHMKEKTGKRSCPTTSAIISLKSKSQEGHLAHTTTTGHFAVSRSLQKTDQEEGEYLSILSVFAYRIVIYHNANMENRSFERYKKKRNFRRMKLQLVQ